jgi:hypothetical protein
MASIKAIIKIIIPNVRGLIAINREKAVTDTIIVIRDISML